MCSITQPFTSPLFKFMMVLSLLFSVLQAQNSEEENMAPEMSETMHPSKGLVISVLTIMFAITFLLLAYVRFCRVSPNEILNQNLNNPQNIHGLTRSGSRFSGINREVIETLPFFRFSSIKGSKEGLECTVCLSKFEESEILRLLPKCQHAFHKNCIDKWLERHSTCPLCRYRVEPGDIKNLTYSLSSRFLRAPSNLTDDPNLEIYVQREPSHRGSSRFSVGSGFWELGKSKKQEELLIDHEEQEGGDSSGSGRRWNDTNNKNQVHKLNHRIVISDVVTRSRWSDLNSSDLLSLSFEILNDVSSARFSPEKLQGDSSLLVPSTSNEEENSFTALNNNRSEKRSMSEIANVPRFAEIRKHNREYVTSGGDNIGREEDRFWRIWMPIASKTVQWLARRERNSDDELGQKRLGSNV